MFQFCVSTNVQFGCGVREKLPQLLSKEGWERVGCVVDHNLANTPGIEKLLNEIRAAVKLTVISKCSISEPTYDSLEKVRQDFRDPSLQAIIGIGGGSAIDMAKAMAVLVHNTKPAISYRGFDKTTAPVLPIIAIPTTAGTGSEVTPNASFVDTVEKRKMGINGEVVRPKYAFLDPELTLSCPIGPTVSAAVDSLVHASEAYVAKKTNAIARLFAKEGFARVFVSLPKLFDDPQNLHLRTEVMLGAFFSGVALMHSGTGPAAAMSYPLGVRYGVPHGIAGGIFLPLVIANNIRQDVLDYADLLTEPNAALSSRQKAEQLVEGLSALLHGVGIPGENILRCGFDQYAIDQFVEETLELGGALDQNPVPFGRNEIEGALRTLIDTSNN